MRDPIIAFTEDLVDNAIWGESGVLALDGSEAVQKNSTPTDDANGLTYAKETEALTNSFKNGNKSQAVKDFQIELLRRGIDVVPDGSYGPNTQAAWDDYSVRRAGGEEFSILSGKNPSQEQINSQIKDLSKKYDISEKSLSALLKQESSFRQFDRRGKPLLPPFSSGISSAVGLGQITAKTAGLTDNSFDYQRLATDWKYNLESSVNIFNQGYDHSYATQFTNERSRAGRAYGMYHDGFDVYKGDNTVDSQYEKQYLERYDSIK